MDDEGAWEEAEEEEEEEVEEGRTRTQLEYCALNESQPGPGAVPKPPLQWRTRAKLPSAMAVSHVLQSGSSMYVGGGTAMDSNAERGIFEYNMSEDNWRELPKAPCYRFALALVNNCLTTVGGISVIKGGATSALYNFDSERKKWCRQYPDMCTSRYSCSCASLDQYVVVLGGVAEDEHTVLDTVEVLDVQRLVWTRVSSLPHPVTYVSCLLCEAKNTMYLVGGASDIVWSCGTRALCTSRDGETNSLIWKEVTKTPHLYCGGAYYSGRLIVAGGIDRDFNVTSAVHAFDVQSNSWVSIGVMSTPKSCCSLALLQHTTHSSLLVLGGSPPNWSKAVISDVTEAVNLDGCLP